MPVHQSDILDYIWTLIDHVPINQLPPCASFIAGTEAGVAPPRVNFTAFMPLIGALGAVRAFLSNQSEETPPIIHLSMFPGGSTVAAVTIPELNALAQDVYQSAVGDGQPCLILTTNLDHGMTSFGSTLEAMPQQFAANLWLAIKSLIEIYNASDGSAPSTSCGLQGAYVLATYTDANGIQGAGFVVPRVREAGLRVGCIAEIVGLQREVHLNGTRVKILHKSGLKGCEDGWFDIRSNPCQSVDRWAVELHTGEYARLKPDNLAVVETD